MAKAKNEEKMVGQDKNPPKNNRNHKNAHRGHRPPNAQKKPNAPAKDTARVARELPPKKPRSAGIDHLFADFLPPIALESEKKTVAPEQGKNAPKGKKPKAQAAPKTQAVPKTKTPAEKKAAKKPTEPKAQPKPQQKAAQKPIEAKPEPPKVLVSYECI